MERFKYLGSNIIRDGRREEEIRARINMAKNAFHKIKSLVTNRATSMGLRKAFLKTYVWVTILYGCEAWVNSLNLEEKLETVEIWLLRRMMRLSWVERVTNEKMLQQAGVKREIVESVRQRQMKLLRHVMRQQQMENLCLTGEVEGRRGKGRPRTKFLDSLTKSVGGSYTPFGILRKTADRSEWRLMMTNVLDDTAPR